MVELLVDLATPCLPSYIKRQNVYSQLPCQLIQPKSSKDGQTKANGETRLKNHVSPGTDYRYKGHNLIEIDVPITVPAADTARSSPVL